MTRVEVRRTTCECSFDCGDWRYRCVVTHPSLPAGFIQVTTGLTARRAVLEAFDLLTIGQGVWPVRRLPSGALNLRYSLAKDGT